MSNVRLQKVRDFTVQIRRDDETIVGTGVVVCSTGLIATCAHVVLGAGVNPRGGAPVPTFMELLAQSIYKRVPDQGRVRVYFPKMPADEKKSFEAVVYAHARDGEDDDIVLLKLVGDLPLLGPDQVAAIGTAADSEMHKFVSYGYRRLAKYEGGRADGRINGSVETPKGRKLRVEPVEITSNKINEGMSGAAVLDVERNLVVGLIGETWFADGDGKDRDTAWAIDAEILTLEPFLLAQRAVTPDRMPGLFVRDVLEPPVPFSPLTFVKLVGAPNSITDWVGRRHSLIELANLWTLENSRVVAVVGANGSGKSALARRWVDDLTNAPVPQLPAAVFWYTFENSTLVDEFFDAALTFLTGGAIDPKKLPTGIVRSQVLGSVLGTRRFLFVLDGFENAQYATGDRNGELKSEALREFVLSLAAGEFASRCLITSSIPLADLADYTSYSELRISGLSQEEARVFLRGLGVEGTDAQLDDLASRNREPFYLRILGSLVREQFQGSACAALARFARIDPK